MSSPTLSRKVKGAMEAGAPQGHIQETSSVTNNKSNGNKTKSPTGTKIKKKLTRARNSNKPQKLVPVEKKNQDCDLSAPHKQFLNGGAGNNNGRGLLSFGRRSGKKKGATNNKTASLPHPSSRISAARRPSLGGAYTTHRASMERRSSLDTNFGSTRPWLTMESSSLSSDDRPKRRMSISAIAPPPSQQRPGISPELLSVYRNTNNDSATTTQKQQHPVVKDMMAAIHKSDMMDVTLMGKDGARVQSCRFILACRVGKGLQNLLYPDDETSSSRPTDVYLGNYSETTIKALVEYCFSGELCETFLATDETADAATGLVELAQLAQQYQFRALLDKAYQMTRRLLNRKASLACAVYNVSATMRDFEAYALQTIQDVPTDALLDNSTSSNEKPGVQYLSAKRLQDLLKDLGLDDDMLVLQILQQWLQCQPDAEKETALHVARECAAQSIQLQRMEMKHLEGTVCDSGLFDAAAISNAIAAQQAQAQEQDNNVDSKQNVDRVLVSGAGMESVNGIYHREEQDDDNDEAETDKVMYTKENVHGQAFGLYQWGSTWGIASALDLSNHFYVCKTAASDDERPVNGWKTEMAGVYPPPTCTWMAAAGALKQQQQHSETSSSTASKTTSSSSTSTTPLPACFASEQALYGN